MTEQFHLRLVERYDFAPNFHHLAFERTDGEGLTFVPGQFVQFHLDGFDGVERRSYSIATIAEEGVAQRVEIAVSYVAGGVATSRFETLQIGDELPASGPYGRFCLRDEEAVDRYVLVATGTGVTPYRAMLPVIARRGAQGLRAVVVFGVRNQAELLYAQDFEALADRDPHFEFWPCFSRQARSPAGPHDRRGYVQDRFSDLELEPERDVVYLCGNPNMVDHAAQWLKNHGFENRSIRREKYVSPRRPKPSLTTI